MTVVLLHDLKAVVIFLPKSAKTIIEANKIVFIKGNGNASWRQALRLQRKIETLAELLTEDTIISPRIDFPPVSIPKRHLSTKVNQKMFYFYQFFRQNFLSI